MHYMHFFSKEWLIWRSKNVFKPMKLSSQCYDAALNCFSMTWQHFMPQSCLAHTNFWNVNLRKSDNYYFLISISHTHTHTKLLDWTPVNKCRTMYFTLTQMLCPVLGRVCTKSAHIVFVCLKYVQEDCTITALSLSPASTVRCLNSLWI